MKERFLNITTIVTIIISTIFSLTGCGDNKTSSTSIIEKPIDSIGDQKNDNPTKGNPVVTKQSYCVVVKNVGNISGAIVVSEKGSKAKEVNGKYCFDEKPQTVKIASVGGIDSVLGLTTKCDSMKLDFIEDEALKCSSKVADLNYNETFLASRERAIMFRSYIGDVYELMNIPFNHYDPIILESIEAANITSAKTILNDANITGDQNSAKKEEIVDLMVDLVASPINRDVVTIAILALKSTAQLQDGNLTDGDNGVTKWISDNRDVIEEYILAHDGDVKTRDVQKERVIDLRRFVTQIIKLQRTEMLGIPTTLAELEEIIDPKSIMKFSSDTDITRGPIADIITVEGSLDSSGVALENIYFMNKIDGVIKYYKDDNDTQAPELFTLFQEYIHFRDDINQSLDKYNLIKEYLENLFTINLKVDYNSSQALPIGGKDLLVSAILDFSCSSECSSDKTEYLTLTFPVHVEEESGDFSFVVLADKNVTLTSRVWDGNKSNPSFNRSIINIVNLQSNELINNDMLGVVDINIVKYIDIASKLADTKLSKSIKDLLVRHTSNINGNKPTPMTQYLSIIDITDSSIVPTTFIQNRAIINPADYDLDKASSFYKDIFTEMYQNSKEVNAVAIKTCFTCL